MTIAASFSSVTTTKKREGSEGYESETASKSQGGSQKGLVVPPQEDLGVPEKVSGGSE